MSTGFYIRFKGAASTQRVSDPLPAGHPCLALYCPGCDNQFEQGERVVLVPIGPGGDLETQAKAMSGGWYNAAAVCLHAACAGLPDESPPPVPDTAPPL